MGVPFLCSWMEKTVPDGFYTIHMIEEIEIWKSHNKEPIILIDLKAFTRSLIDKRDNIFGGRGVLNFEKSKHFLTTLRQTGAKLIFFTNGPVQEDNKENVAQKRNSRLQHIFKTLDKLYEDNSVLKIRVCAGGALESGMESIAREFGHVHRSVHSQRDKALAAYAIEVNALAMIVNGSNYLIFQGKSNYWSSNHINFKTMTTKLYSKISLQHYLELAEHEMPLFATLAVLNFLPNKIGDRLDRFQNISQYIVKYLRESEVYKPNVIAQKIFGNINELSEYTNSLEKVLKSYNVNLLEHQTTSIDDDLPFGCGESWCLLSYFDVRKPEFERYTSLAVQLIQRELGMLLQHKNGSFTHRVYGYQSEATNYVCETIAPVYPSITVPILNDLYGTNTSDELKSTKLRLLAWIISDQLDVNAIKDIERKYFCASLTLFCMVENKFITIREADIFLHVVETVYADFSKIRRFKYLKLVDPRAFQIVFLYSKIYKHLAFAISHCGLTDLLLEQDQMDGLSFHHAYNNRGAGDAHINEHLEHLRLYKEL